MKSNFALKNYIHLLLILTMGFFSPLFSAAGAVSQTPLVKGSASENKTKTVQVITVEPEIASLPIVPTDFSIEEAFLGCKSAKPKSGNLVQDQTAVNLNQPASCFKLTAPDANAVFFQKISVATRPFSESVVVVARWPVQTIALFKFGPAPLFPSQSVPVPVLGFVVFAFVVFKFKKVVLKSGSHVLARLTGKFGLLMIMRC